jgi:hypothetical protein
MNEWMDGSVNECMLHITRYVHVGPNVIHALISISTQIYTFDIGSGYRPCSCYRASTGTVPLY